MLQAEAKRPTLRRREGMPGLLALAVSLGVHGAAVASLLFLQVKLAPVPYAVVGLTSLEAGEADGSAEGAPAAVEDIAPEIDSGFDAGREIVSVSQPSRDPVEVAVEANRDADDQGLQQADLKEDPETAAQPSLPPRDAAQPLLPDTATVEEVKSSLQPAAVPGSLRALTQRNPDIVASLPSPPPNEPLRLEVEALLLSSITPKTTHEDSTANELPLKAAFATPPVPTRKPSTPSFVRPPLPSAAQEETTETDFARLPRTRALAARPQTRSDLERGARIARGREEGNQGAGTGSAPRYSGQGLTNVPPRYPRLARRKGQEGRVVLRVRVTAEGKASSVAIQQSSGYPLLDKAAAKAIQEWHFIPASLAGIAMAGKVDVPVTFRLTDQ